MMNYAAARRDFRLDIPEHYNFGFDVIAKRAAEADKTAYIAVDAAVQTVRPVSFSDLDRASNRFVNVLLDLGAHPGDFAFVMIPRLPAWYEVIIACIKAGVVAMPGTNLLTAKDIAYRVNRSAARFAIVTADGAEKVDEIVVACPSLERLIVVGGERDDWTSYEAASSAASDELDRGRVPHSRADDLMLVYFTSGTTAQPKMVPRDHGYALAHTITGRYWMDLGEDDVHWTLSDTGWAKAAWGLLFGPWQTGSSMVLYDAAPGFDTEAHLRVIEACRVSTFCAPPTVYRIFAQADLSGFDLGSIRHSLGAGEPLNPEVMRVWRGITGTEIYDGYGQTETVNIVANIPGLDIRPGSMGKPVPGFDVNIVDDTGTIVDDDTVGHIAVRPHRSPPAGALPRLLQGRRGDEEELPRRLVLHRRHGDP